MSLPRIHLKPLKWSPHLPPVEMPQATERQLKAMRVTPSAKKVSPYVRTLVHDPDSYVARTKLFNAIMYLDGGLPHADRELGALAASRVNGCVYCAVVHARQHIRFTGNSDVVSALYLKRTERLSTRDAAIVEFADALSASPPAVTPAHVDELRKNGLDDKQILDLIHAVAIFGWANRLMHPLGHAAPAVPEETR